MNFFKKLFSGKKEPSKPQEVKEPDNARLIYLLDIYGAHPSQENYKAVYDELASGNSSLLLPSINDSDHKERWSTLKEGDSINLSTVFDVDGLKVLGAFSDEASLLEWTKVATQYTEMKAKDVIDICEVYSIGRLVINSDQKNMYVIERNLSHIRREEIKEDIKVLVGTPSKPLSDDILANLISEFQSVDIIEEAYQFAMYRGDDFSLVLGIRLSVTSYSGDVAMNSAISNVLKEVTLEQPLDVMTLDDHWLETVRGIENAFFYKKNT